MAFDLGDIQDNIQKLLIKVKNTNKEVNNFLNSNMDKLTQLAKDQLLFGRDEDGNPISPSYTSDPYFKSSESARRYASMKAELEAKHDALIINNKLFTKKDSDTPNLIVTGAFHQGIYPQITGAEADFNSAWSKAPEVGAKYNNRIFGYSDEAVSFMWENNLVDYVNLYYLNGLQLY